MKHFFIHIRLKLVERRDIIVVANLRSDNLQYAAIASIQHGSQLRKWKWQILYSQ